MGFVSDLLSRKTIAAQGAYLARQFAERLPKERLGDGKRVSAEFDILLGNALGYQRKSGLGFFGTSHLVNSLQWALVEAGYAEDFAREIGSELASRLASAA